MHLVLILIQRKKNNNNKTVFSDRGNFSFVWHSEMFLSPGNNLLELISMKENCWKEEKKVLSFKIT